jgi:hypothetical protein
VLDKKKTSNRYIKKFLYKSVLLFILSALYLEIGALVALLLSRLFISTSLIENASRTKGTSAERKTFFVSGSQQKYTIRLPSSIPFCMRTYREFLIPS